MKILISEENFIHNINFLKKKYDRDILPVIKANGYGHDLKLIVSLLLKYKINQCVVARLSEALEILRSLSIPKDFKILVLESISEENFKYILDYPQILSTANSIGDILKLLENKIPTTQIQIKIDLGFGRNGITTDEIPLLKEIISKENTKFSGIFSHLFSVPYKKGIELINIFENILNTLGKDRFSMIHLQNSLGISNYGTIPFTTHLRPGMFIYGFYEDGAYEKNLKKVFSLKGNFTAIKNIKNIDYLAYTPKENLKTTSENIGFVKIGYGDGFLKSNEGSFVKIKDKFYKILLLTMDNTFIEVDENINIDDEVEIYFDFDVTKKHLKINICEFLPILSSRIPRILNKN